VPCLRGPLTGAVRVRDQRLDPGMAATLADEVSRDVAGGDPGGSARGDHDVGEVLADTSAATDRLCGARLDVGDSRLVGKRAARSGADVGGFCSGDDEVADASVSSGERGGAEEARVDRDPVEIVRGDSFDCHVDAELNPAFDASRPDVDDDVAESVRACAANGRGHAVDGERPVTSALRAV